MIKLDIIAAFVLLILVIIFASWFGHHKTKPSTSTSSLPPGWGQYQSAEYGLTFSYLKDWGQPSIVALPQQKGKIYNVSFSRIHTNTDKTYSLLLRFESSDLSNKVCNSGHCVTTTSLTKKDVQGTLTSKSKTGIYKFDNDSYSTLNTDPRAKASALIIVRMVDISKLKSSAVMATYNLPAAAATCPAHKPAPAGTKDCITDDTYNNVLRMVKSIQNE